MRDIRLWGMSTLLTTQASIVTVGQQGSHVMSIRFLRLWRCAALRIEPIAVVGLAALLLLLPLSAVTAPLIRGLHGIRTAVLRRLSEG